MQAITVRMLPPTNHRSTRYLAHCQSGSICVNESPLNEDQQGRACRALLEKLEKASPGCWSNVTWVRGETGDGTVYVAYDTRREFEWVKL